MHCPESLPARLLIHAGTVPGVGNRRFDRLLLQWCAWAAKAWRQRPSTPKGVYVDDLQGRQFFASEDAGSLIEVPLPAGTYHVSVRLGDVRRRYTVKLEHGSIVDLYLRS
jgi:hypothetical protein